MSVGLILGSLCVDGYSRIIGTDKLQSTMCFSDRELKGLQNCAIRLPELREDTQPYDLVKVSGMNCLSFNYLPNFNVYVKPHIVEYKFKYI